MREIKFRAWVKSFDNVGWEMVHSAGIYPADSRHLGPLCASSDGIFVRADRPDEVILMQFTGLLDKNGKEIYEGDVVRDHFAAFDGTDLGKRWVVEFGEYDDSQLEWGSPGIGFYCDATKADPEHGIQSIVYLHEPEVIGNIYENPELKEGG